MLPPQLQFVGGEHLHRMGAEPVIATAADPAAGAEVSFTVPTGEVYIVHAVTVELVTAVAAANRRVNLTLDDGTTKCAEIPSPADHIASLTRQYSWFNGDSVANVGGGAYSMGLPAYLLMWGGYRIRTLTEAIQAADDFGVMAIYATRFYT